MRADVIDYLRVEKKMHAGRIRAGLHTLAPSRPATGSGT